MIGLVLKPEKGFKALQLVRIHCPLIYHSNSEKENSFDEESACIFKVTEEDVALRKSLGNLQALCTGEHPFVAWPIGPALIQLVCTKTVVAKLFKAIFAQQRVLGVRLADLKSHVILSPMDSEELLQACSLDILSSLQKHSCWYPVQAGTLLVGLDPMSTADGRPQITSTLDIKIENSGNDAIVLLLKPSTVRFRHSTVAAFSNHSTLSDASKAAEGSLCRVLPTLTPAIIHRLRIASDKEAMEIEYEWSRAGFSLPLENSSESSSSAAAAALYNIVDVRFEEDEDAPTTPFPACAVLSYLGFDPVDTKLNSPGVLGALHRLQEDLKNGAYKLFGGGSVGSRTSGLLIKEMRRWDDTYSIFNNKASSDPATKKTRFQSAADMMKAAPATAGATVAPPSAFEKLGEMIDLCSLQAGLDGGDGSGQGTKAAFKRPHARAGPELRAYLARLEKEEAAEAAAATLKSPQKKTALPPSMALAIQTAKAAPLKKIPLLGAKRALPTAAAATEKKVAKAPKKGTISTAAAAAPKAPKPPAAEIDVVSLDVPGLVAAGKLATLTIPQLKAYCRSIKQPVGGKKSDLETRIKTHLGISVEQ
ncbi:hypothetical protein Ndes2526A_g05525 [Nannochloris sp. 'desiccata']